MHLEYVLNLKRKHNCLERCSSRSTFNREVEYKIILAEVSSGAGRPPSSSRPLSTCHSQWKGVSKQWFVNFIVCVYICTRVCGYIYIYIPKKVVLFYINTLKIISAKLPPFRLTGPGNLRFFKSTWMLEV